MEAAIAGSAGALGGVSRQPLSPSLRPFRASTRAACSGSVATGSSGSVAGPADPLRTARNTFRRCSWGFPASACISVITKSSRFPPCA
jgi:hypothetical protein